MLTVIVLIILPRFFHFYTFETYNLIFYHLVNQVANQKQAVEQLYMESNKIFPISFQFLLK